VVVDNASADDSVAWTRQHYPEVRIVEAGGNVGFAAANNLGIAASRGDHVALLNTDAIPDPEWLVKAAGAMADPAVASAASCMVFADRPEVVNSAGICVDRAGIAWDRLGGTAVGDPEVGRPAEVFGASAGAALYRRSALDDVAEPAGGGTAAARGRGADATAPGRAARARDTAVSGPGTGADHGSAPPSVFDPAFFMYMEDVDLAWRLRLRGWRSVYVPEARVRHVGSGTSGEGSAFKNRLLARNKVWTIAKCYPGGALAVRFPLILLYDLASAPYRILAQGQTAAFRGRVDAIGGLPRVLAQRRRIQMRRTASSGEVLGAMEPWAAPWAVLRRYRHLRPSPGARDPSGPARPGAGRG
jgi:GT2 family glycosyltransferase